MKTRNNFWVQLTGLAVAWMISWPMALLAQAPASERILKADDEILITVFGEDNLTTETRISKSGQIVFPLVGSLQLAGKTVQEAVADLTQRLNQGIVVDPKVSIAVTGYSVDQAIVAGHVRKPGPIELPSEGGLDLLSAIATAGGFAEHANSSKVAVRRMVEGKTKVYRFDARKIAEDEAEDSFEIKAGDIITVAEQIDEQIAVLGEVRNPGMVDIAAGETKDILQVIAMAGAFSESGDPTRVRVTRWKNGKKAVHEINVDILINDANAKSFAVGSGDVVTVPTIAQLRVTVMGQVNKPGVIDMPRQGAFSLLDAIASAGGYTQIANPKKVIVRRTDEKGNEQVLQIDARKLVSDPRARSFDVLPNDTIMVPESFF